MSPGGHYQNCWPAALSFSKAIAAHYRSESHRFHLLLSNRQIICRDVTMMRGLKDGIPGICMMTSLNGNIFRVTGPLCGEFTGHRWIPLTKTSDADLWCFLRLNKRLSKQSKPLWFDMPSHPLWRHCNVTTTQHALFWNITIVRMSVKRPWGTCVNRPINFHTNDYITKRSHKTNICEC